MRDPAPMITEAHDRVRDTSTAREQSINLCQKLVLFFLVHLASRLARIPGMGRADPAVFAEHEHRRKRVEIHGLWQFLRRLIGLAGGVASTSWNGLYSKQRPHTHMSAG